MNRFLNLVYHIKLNNISPPSSNIHQECRHTMNGQVGIRRHEASFLMMQKAVTVGYCCYLQQHSFCLDSHLYQTDCTSLQKTALQRKAVHEIQPAEKRGESQGRQSAGRCMFQCAMLEHRQIPAAGSKLQIPTSMMHLPFLPPPGCHHD